MSNQHNFDAVIFDLDGVITKTALVHSVAWTRMFNDYLKFREEKYGEKHREFTHEDDYLLHVDGKPRYKGVGDFLTSRDISIPFGDLSDSTEKETICGLGNRKNQYFTMILENDGVEQYESTVDLIKKLKSEGISVGVASSSKNCKMVLETTGLIHLFETRVDGIVSAELGLKGKPEPDIFTTACDNLGVAYDKAVVVEDAVSGVQAGAAGGFGLTIGVAREGNKEELRKNGADIVVEDLSEIGGIESIDRWFSDEVDRLKWGLVYRDYIPGNEKSREALLTIGNGFFATRGSLEEVSAGEYNYPGSYMTGLYNRRKSKVGDRWIENEDLVNFINWLPVGFRPEGDNWFDPNKDELLSYERFLDLKSGLLNRKIITRHQSGKETFIESRRFVSMADHGTGGLEYSITPVNYTGSIELYSCLDGDLTNNGVERYNDLDQNHLEHFGQGKSGSISYVTVKTNESGILVSAAEKVTLWNKGNIVESNDFVVTDGKVNTMFKTDVGKGEKIVLQKIIRIENSRDYGVENPQDSVIQKLSKTDDFNTLLQASREKWKEIWDISDIQIEGDRFSQMLVRLHIYHLIVTASPHYQDLDSGIPARGLHGEAYRGHIFWDELYILPFFISRFPATAKSILMYRYRRLPMAKEYAKTNGYEGAMYPWQSGSSGREETQVVHLNPVSGEWGSDYSSLQRHISIAIAYNIWEYYHISDDQDFMSKYGAEMFLEICRFWASISVKDNESDRYSIEKVMGPDEFHEKLPGSKEGGLKDNAYTNLMVVWCMKRAFDILDSMETSERKTIVDKIGLLKEEIVKWKEISIKMKLIFNSDYILEQFEGYFNLKELNWEDYRKRYKDIHRLDRILKAEGKSPDEYKLAKQADVLMLFYILKPEEVIDLIKGLSYKVPQDLLEKNLDYYIKRTSHGSTLSRVVHAYLAGITWKPEICRDLFMDALSSDYTDIQGGTTAEGIHAGVMGGTVLFTISMFGGLNWRNEILSLTPELPNQWQSLSFKFLFKKTWYTFNISRYKIIVKANCYNNESVHIIIKGNRYELHNEKELIVEEVEK